MKNLRLFGVGLLAVFLSFTFSTCSDDDSDGIRNPTFNEPESIVKIYTDEEAKYVAEEIVSSDKIIFSENTPDDIIPEIGTIIQLPISENAPYGFLGRVVSINEGESIVIGTEEVPLDEAYPFLSIDTVINVFDDIIGVFDEDGNPVEYTIKENETPNKTRVDMGEFDWESKTLEISIPTDFLGDEFSASGKMSLSFKGSKFDLDNKDNLRYLNLEICPTISLGASITTEIKGKNKDFESKTLVFKSRAAVGPVVIPITVPICFKAGVGGEITSTLGINYSKSSKVYLRYINGDWSSGCVPMTNKDENPWSVSSFDVNGSLYAGINIEFIAGLYTRNVGIGIELFPNASLSANASLSSINPFDVNPEVAVSVGMSSSIHCEAKIFGKGFDVFKINLPELVFYKRTLSLFPNISNFEAIGSSRSAELSYQSDSYYFLQALGVKTGAILYKDDKKTEVNRYYPSHNKIDNNGIRYYNTNVTGLSDGETYYAAPIISWLNYKWDGDLVELTTEANYTLAFRCTNHSYDVIKFNFSLNNIQENALDYTTEAQDYDGSPMRVHITAKYNASTKTLDGLFDFYFYNHPDQKRKDGFSVSLKTDDSGYVDCSKVIDNEGCYAALRIYKSSSKQAAKRLYNEAISEDDCNIGLCNENY